MGQSTDALLWYGLAVDDDSGLHEKLDLLANGPEDDNEYLDGDGREWFTAHGLEGKVVVVRHCSCDYAMYGLAIVGTFPDGCDKAVLAARRGSPKAFPSLPDIQPEWADIIGAVLRGLGFGEDDDLKPSWCLASDWC